MFIALALVGVKIRRALPEAMLEVKVPKGLEPVKRIPNSLKVVSVPSCSTLMSET